jgi:alpha-ketoglutarate-dependent taurine dioxygenase
MRPVTPEGANVLRLLDDTLWTEHTEVIRWRTGTAVVIDNWRVLHGRGDSVVPDNDRLLLRVYVNGDDK